MPKDEKEALAVGNRLIMFCPTELIKAAGITLQGVPGAWPPWELTGSLVGVGRFSVPGTHVKVAGSPL